jgi:hypothetical protein
MGWTTVIWYSYGYSLCFRLQPMRAGSNDAVLPQVALNFSASVDKDQDNDDETATTLGGCDDLGASTSVRKERLCNRRSG